MKYVFGLLGAIITILVNIMINIIIIEVEVVVEQWFTTWLVSELTGGGGEVEWSGGERSGAGCKIYQSSLLLVLGNSKQKKNYKRKNKRRLTDYVTWFWLYRTSWVSCTKIVRKKSGLTYIGGWGSDPGGIWRRTTWCRKDYRVLAN